MSTLQNTPKKPLTQRKEQLFPPPAADPSVKHRRFTMDKLIKNAKEKRRSWSGKPPSPGPSGSKSPKGSGSGSPKLGPLKVVKPIQLDIDMESPPLVSYGNTNVSTGALLSGRLNIIINDDEAQLTRLDMVLVGTTTTKKPVSKDCPECQSRSHSLFVWKFLTEPHTYPRGTTSLPFSYLIGGHFPATSHSSLGMIEYHLQVTGHTPTIDPPVLYTRQLLLQRAIRSAQTEHHSIRVFPPTNVTCTITSPPVIYPIGSFNVQARLEGIYEDTPQYLRRWRLRRIEWRLEEIAQIISPACLKHVHKLGHKASDGKGIQHTEVRTLAKEELHEGWKTDYGATGGGATELEFTVGLNPSAQPTCDVESPNGYKVTHNIVLELITFEEYSISKKAPNFVPTGTAKVLKMTVSMKITERSGMGISWDEEQPPLYEDVPISPPVYASISDFTDMQELDRLESLEI